MVAYGSFINIITLPNSVRLNFKAILIQYIPGKRLQWAPAPYIYLIPSIFK